VVVSNQDAVVTTDSSGAFTIPQGPGAIVFVSVPDGHRAVGPFWRRTESPTAVLAFPLQPVARISEFSFVHASDTHIAPASADRMRRLRALVDSLDPAFVLIAGDLVRDAMRVPEEEATSYYDLFVAETRVFTAPVFTVPGNHENFGIVRSMSHVAETHPLYGRAMYRRRLGPDYYSFTWGGVHFVGLNSISYDDSAYYGNIDSLQLAWLERDLARVPRDMPVVTFNHIPLVTAFTSLAGFSDEPMVGSLARFGGKVSYRHQVANAVQVIDLLRGHPYPLALGAHIHAGERIAFETGGGKTRFEQSAAIVGPGRIGRTTFRSGFTVYTVRNGTIDEDRFVPLDPGMPDNRR
jgi:hypothetical protein